MLNSEFVLIFKTLAELVTSQPQLVYPSRKGIDGVGVVVVAIAVGLAVTSPRFHLARGTSFYSF